MKRILALISTVVILLVMLNGCATTKSKASSITLTIAGEKLSCLSFEYNGDNPYCFYGYDIDGKYYRVIWDNFDDLHSGDVIRVEYSEEIKSLTYDEYPYFGWTPSYEVKATAIKVQQRANKHLVSHILIKSGENEIYPYGRLLQAMKDNGDGTFSEMLLNVVTESTIITEYREQIPEIVYDGPITYNIQANGRIENIRLYDYNGENLKGDGLSFDDLSDLEEGTYYVCFYVWVEETDTNALHAFYLYEDIFALIVD